MPKNLLSRTYAGTIFIVGEDLEVCVQALDTYRARARVEVRNSVEHIAFALTSEAKYAY
jgi:hypothetical protein